MGIIERLIAKQFSRSPKVETDRQDTPESRKTLDVLLCESKELQEATEKERVLEDEKAVWVRNGETLPPVGAVITGYLFVNNAPKAYTYEIPTVEGLLAYLRHEEKQENGILLL